MSYEKKKKTKKRKRNIVYFHPPYCKSVRTNIGRVFRNLVVKHFTSDHPLFKILNKNTIKLSYSCLPNVKTTISAHNKAILHDNNIDQASTCNYKSMTCPLDGKCLMSNVVYKAVVSVPSAHKEDRVYIGSTSQTFKKRFYQHSASFKNDEPNRSTTLSSYISNLKKKDIKYQIKWSIIHQSKQTSKSIWYCSLCNLEKMAIALAKKKTLLNSRNELIAMCRHNTSLFF